MRPVIAGVEPGRGLVLLLAAAPQRAALPVTAAVAEAAVPPPPVLAVLRGLPRHGPPAGAAETRHPRLVRGVRVRVAGPRLLRAPQPPLQLRLLAAAVVAGAAAGALQGKVFITANSE